MSARKAFIISTLSVVLALTATAASAQTALRSPGQVKEALTTLNRVVDHTQRLIDAKNYLRLPKENGEFKEGAEALEAGIHKEPADFKATVKPLLRKAEADSQSVADAAKAHDDAKLAVTHAAFAGSVKAVLAAFPEAVQPAPPSVTKEKAEDKAPQ